MKFAAIGAWAVGAMLVSGPAHAGLLDDKPVGWASQSGGVTGGQGASVQEVTTIADLQRLAKEAGKKILLVKGRLGDGRSRIEVTSDKTIFGLPGAVIAGGFDIKSGVSNVIVRNLKVEGPGAKDVDGADCISIQGCQRIWFDHLDIVDGEDGNLDITNEADLVTVSWCKFTYTSKSTDHQFSNLIGSDDGKTGDRGKLRVTLHHNWWSDGVKERMPRVRFGQVHVANNLFNSSAASHCVRAGIEADLLIEGNAFIGVGKPIDLYEDNFKAVTARNNLFTNTSGNTAGKNTAFTPPYTLTLDPASAVEAKIKGQASGFSAAGATLPDPRITTAVLLMPQGARRTHALAAALPGGPVYTPELLMGRRFDRP
jgi:pectate lyase